MTGMSIFGKMSVGVRRITAGLSKRIRIATTMNVYGRLRANLTIHMDSPWRWGSPEDSMQPRMPPVLSDVFRDLSDDSYRHLFRLVHVRCLMRPLGLSFIARFITVPLISKSYRPDMHK